MPVEEELARVSPEKDMLLTIGVFDGVHLGHKYLISTLLEQAKQRDLLTGVVTFQQHPHDLLSPQTRLPFLTDITERGQLLTNEGVDEIIPLTFTKELSRLSAYQFVNLLQKHLRMRGLVIGPDFSLGRDREGDTKTLRGLGQEMNFSVTVVPPMTKNGESVSSTVIRKAISDGDMKKVTRLAGRPFSLHGRVITGTGRGAKLNFPTANPEINPEQAIPPDGVYASWAFANGKKYQSMTNIGKCPTFGNYKRTVEVYIIGYNGNLYGQELKIDIIERLRNERKFDSVEGLTEQIAKDIKQGEAILKTADGQRV
jgi:riboflavin kinase/FMN adenylyltransferase